MAQVFVPDSLPLESQNSTSQRPADWGFEPTQLSQPYYSQTQQNTQGFPNSQIEPRRKYWAILIPTTSSHAIVKVSWAKSHFQIGRGHPSQSGNDLVLVEKRVSNKHCVITLGLSKGTGSHVSNDTIQSWKDGEAEPEVWLEDLNSSNGTFVNGERVRHRVLLQHGDEISLGHNATMDNHDVRYIFRSVGGKGAKFGRNGSKNGIGMVGEVYERYQFLDRLGKGTFAEVHRAVELATGNMRAIKQIVKHRFEGNQKTLTLFQREINICSTLEHENICRLIEYFEDPQHICLVLEYVDGGDLLDYIMDTKSPTGGGLSEEVTARLTLQICSAMAYTHAKGVTHRDLKPENILITQETPTQPATVKVADFGLAKMVEAGTMLVSMVGTPQYLAPEVVMQSKQQPGYDNLVDSWSVGIIVYSMLTKALPFDEDASMPVDKRIRARFTQEPDFGLLANHRVSDTGIDFIARLLAKNPAERMTMAEALNHDWLAGPSSQQSQPNHGPLGGDSMWEIKSFDDEEEDSVMFGSEVGSEGGWTRPGTVSGTNLESRLGGESSFYAGPGEGYVDSDESLRRRSKGDGKEGRVQQLQGQAQGSSEDFSQPMGNLQLTTPAPKRQTSNEIDNEAPDPTSPTRPNKNGVDGPNGEQSELGDRSVETPENKVDDSLLTPPLSDIAPTSLKRKQVALDAFSSGSLSPPPSSQPKGEEAAPPAASSRSSKQKTNGKSKSSPATIAAKEAGKVSPTSDVSPRRSNRPRKSLRKI